MGFLRKLFKTNNQSNNDPTNVIIFGNGYFPEQEKAFFLYDEWLVKRKVILGIETNKDAAILLNESRFFSDRTMFAEYTKISIKYEYPDHFSDELMLLDQQTGKDLILYALWSPDVTPRIKTLLGK